MTLKMTTAQVVETSVTVTNSSFQNYTHPDDHTTRNTQDIDDFEDPFGIDFPAIDYYFRTTHFEEYSDFVTFYNTLKSDEVKEKFKDLVKAVDVVLYLQIDN